MKKYSLLILILLTCSFAANKGMKVYIKGGTPIDVAVSSIDSIVFYDMATTLTEKTLDLYNPYAKDGFNSAYDFVNDVAVAAEVDGISGKMKYAAVDSLAADIAVDNSLDIRETVIVTELTSINGGMFTEVTTADYTDATDLSVKALVASKTFTDTEAIMFEVGHVFLMKLAGDRGAVIFTVTAIDATNTEGSTGNTGKISLKYKYTK